MNTELKTSLNQKWPLSSRNQFIFPVVQIKRRQYMQKHLLSIFFKRLISSSLYVSCCLFQLLIKIRQHELHCSFLLVASFFSCNEDRFVLQLIYCCSIVRHLIGSCSLYKPVETICIWRTIWYTVSGWMLFYSWANKQKNRCLKILYYAIQKKKKK